MLPNNTLLQDRYRIVEQIGRGGMGAVYKATDTRLRTIIALKQTLVEGEPLRRAFEREAQLLASLRHPTLPRVSDHFIDQQGQFLVMEYIPGDDLGALLDRRRRPFEVAEVLRWAAQLLDALDYLHTREPPVIHRDIKPQNMKLTERGEIILLDFGLAKGAAVQTRVTSTGSIFGYTPHYAPLEQIQGTGTDRRSDLYSLAATLYQLLTAQIPVDALTRATAMVNDEPDPLALANEINPDVPPAVAALLFQAMAQKASQRPPSAAAMRALLRDAERGGAAPPGTPADIATVAAAPALPGAPPTLLGAPPTLPGAPTLPSAAPAAGPTMLSGGAGGTRPLAAPATTPLDRDAAATITPTLPPPSPAAPPRRGWSLWLLAIPVLLLLGAAAAFASGALSPAPAASPTPAAAAAATLAPAAPTSSPAPTVDILAAAGATQTTVAATQQAFNSLVGAASQQTTTAAAAGQQTSAAQTAAAAPTATSAPSAAPAAPTAAPTAAPAAAGPTRTPRPTSTPGASKPTATTAAQTSGSVLSVGTGGQLLKGSARKGTIAPEEGQGGSCIQGQVLASDGSKFSSFYVQVDNRGKTTPAKHFYDTGNYKICGLGAGEWGVAVYSVNGTATSGSEQAGHQVRVNLSGQPGEVFFVDFRARAGFAPPTETPTPSEVPPTPTPQPGPYDGEWSGPISGKTVGDAVFNGSFRMEVRGNAIYRISIDGPSCLFETYPNFPSGRPLSGAGFALSGSPFNPKLGTDGSITFNIAGSFSSASKAAGTLSASQNGGSCAEATWSASKQ